MATQLSICKYLSVYLSIIYLSPKFRQLDSFITLWLCCIRLHIALNKVLLSHFIFHNRSCKLFDCKNVQCLPILHSLKQECFPLPTRQTAVPLHKRRTHLSAYFVTPNFHQPFALPRAGWAGENLHFIYSCSLFIFLLRC